MTWWIAGLAAGVLGALATTYLVVLARRTASMNQDELFLVAPALTTLGALALARALGDPWPCSR